MMRRQSSTFLWACLCVVVATRVVSRSRLLYDIDSVNFALGMERFDTAAHQPHPPGYFLYICLARLAKHIFTDANSALVAISIVASCGAAWMIYLLTREWFGAAPARAAAVLFVASPLCWFHGVVALTYIVEAFFSAAVGYLAWRSYRGDRLAGIGASAVLAVAAGFRPSIGLLLGPLWLLTVAGMRNRERLLAALGGAALALAWFVPMVQASGGWSQYFDALAHLWRSVPGQRTTLASPWLAVARLLTIAWIYVLCFGAASPFLFRRDAGEPPAVAGLNRFVWTWVTPGLFFFGFVFLNFVNSGYLLVLSPPVFAFVGRGVSGFLRSPGNRQLRWAGSAAGIVANVAFFAAAPLYCTYRSIRVFERQMTTVAQDLNTSFDPGRTLIVGFDSHFLGYRHAGYYLPDFVTAQYPEVSYGKEKRVFLMRNRQTTVAREFRVGQFDRFVFFPLPAGGQYADYLETVKATLPANALRTETIANTTVLTGPASLIPILFSKTTRQELTENEPRR